MNILVSSAGRRVKIVEYIKKNLEFRFGKVVATDCDSQAPALYFADDYEIVPKVDNPKYVDILLGICKKHKINGIISLIDPELEILAENKARFEEISVDLVLSPLDVIQKTFDKSLTYKWLEKLKIPVVPTYQNYNQVLNLSKNNKINFPLVIKPAKGSASLGIYVVSNTDELKDILKKSTEFIIQPYYKDKEFGIDVYIDVHSGKLVDLFIKEKTKMRSGETDKSISVYNEKILQLVEKFITKTSFKGPIDIDCFQYKGDYYISEINPRFGGGYPHAYESGCNFIDYILMNLNGKSNEKFSNYNYKEGTTMMKYDNVLVQ